MNRLFNTKLPKLHQLLDSTGLPIGLDWEKIREERAERVAKEELRRELIEKQEATV